MSQRYNFHEKCRGAWEETEANKGLSKAPHHCFILAWRRYSLAPLLPSSFSTSWISPFVFLLPPNSNHLVSWNLDPQQISAGVEGEGWIMSIMIYHFLVLLLHVLFLILLCWMLAFCIQQVSIGSQRCRFPLRWNRWMSSAIFNASWSLVTSSGDWESLSNVSSYLERERKN